MPELPEVETIRRGLSDLIVGREILGVESDSPKQVKPSFDEVKKAVLGTKIESVKRRAKLLLIHLSNGKILAVHLKLTGRLLVREKGAPKDNWQHVTLILSGGKELRFADARKFGWIKLVGETEVQRLLSEFGPEPLDGLDLKLFQKILSSSGRAVKIILMDQKKVSGIGNIYANDALWLAKINPKRKANSLNKIEQKKLFDAVNEALKRGIKWGGASELAFVTPGGTEGEYQNHTLAYRRDGEPCERCQRAKFVKIYLGGRGTFFCPVCQKED